MQQSTSGLSPLKPVFTDGQLSSLFLKLSDSCKPIPQRFSNQLLKQKLAASKPILLEFTPLQQVNKHQDTKSETNKNGNAMDTHDQTHENKIKYSAVSHWRPGRRRAGNSCISQSSNTQKTHLNASMSTINHDNQKQSKGATRSIKRLKSDEENRHHDEVNSSLDVETSRKHQICSLSRSVQTRNKETIDYYSNYYKKSIDKEIKAQMENKSKESFNGTLKVTKWQPILQFEILSRRTLKPHFPKNGNSSKMLQKNLKSFYRTITVKKEPHLLIHKQIRNLSSPTSKLPIDKLEDSKISEWDTQNTFFLNTNKNVNG